MEFEFGLVGGGVREAIGGLGGGEGDALASRAGLEAFASEHDARFY